MAVLQPRKRIIAVLCQLFDAVNGEIDGCGWLHSVHIDTRRAVASQKPGGGTGGLIENSPAALWHQAADAKPGDRTGWSSPLIR